MSFSSGAAGTGDLLGLDDFTDFNSAVDTTAVDEHDLEESKDSISTNRSPSPVQSNLSEESLHATPSASTHPTTTEPNTTGISSAMYAGLPPINYSLYSLPDFKPEATDRTILTTRDKKYAGSRGLKQLILSQATLPPKPTIVVIGHMGNDRFLWFKMNIMGLICSERSKPWRYSEIFQPSKLGLLSQTDKIPESGEIEGLDELIQAYLIDPAPQKQLVIERSVVNWNTPLIEHQIRALITAMKFVGAVRVTFPTLHSKIIIRPPDKTYRIVSSLATMFKDVKEYKVRICWPYADIESGSKNRICAVQSEGDWWEEWKEVIKYAVVEKRSWDKWITNEDKLEAAMAPRGPNGRYLVWGRETPSMVREV